MTIRHPEALAERANNLGAAGLNGIDLVLVELHPTPNPTEARLAVHFHTAHELADIEAAIAAATAAPADVFPITGGHRRPAGPLTGQVQVTAVATDPARPRVLRLTVAPIGDYSTYTLGVVWDRIDPVFGQIDFKFRPGCFNLCAPDREAPPAPRPEPAINYLAKDFDSFRHTLIAWMMDHVPGWQATSEADLDQTLLELFSAAADELSDYQDRVMNEAYLSTARKRVSLARHARLMDYHIHQGNQATTWLALEIAPPHSVALDDRFLVGTAGNLADDATVVFQHKATRPPLFAVNSDFQVDLDAGVLSNELRDRFADHGAPLSMNLVVTLLAPDQRWEIADQDSNRLYLVRKVGDQLEVVAPHLHALLNQFELYTWSGAFPALDAGSTSADLRMPDDAEATARTVQNLLRSDAVTHLLVQEHLNPVTGQPAGRDPQKRQLLELLPGSDAADALEDPLTGHWLVRVRWAERDALTQRYCFRVECPGGPVEDVSRIHGNLIQVGHGRPVTTRFRPPGAPLAPSGEAHYEHVLRGWTRCPLPDGPLAYRDTPPGGAVPPVSTLAVEVETDGVADPWDEVISLVHSDDSDEQGDHFVVETDEEGRSVLRFGNGVNGRSLPEGAVVHCSYQVGRGLDGNVGADRLRYFDADAYSAVSACWNPFGVTNGRAPEPVAEIVRRVPEAYRARQLRAVTVQDYVDRAEELDEVARAAAQYRWTGSWRTVRVAIDPAGTTTLEAGVIERVAEHLNAVRLIGEDLEIRPPRFVPLQVEVRLCIHPGYWPEDVRSVLEEVFSTGYTADGRRAFFHPDQWTFGQPLYASQVLGAAQAVEGVDHVIEVRLRRWNAATPGFRDRIDVRSNEIILVDNDPDHLERGFIAFDIQGGRR